LEDLMTDRSRDRSDAPVVKSTPEARQGSAGHNVRYVLIIALAAVIILFAIIYGYFFR
jgi:hypothetical protein